MKIPRSGHRNKVNALVTYTSIVFKASGNLLIKSIMAFFLSMMLLSCMNDLEEIKSLDINDTLPDMVAKEVKVLYSERAKVQMELIAPKIVRYIDEEEITEFPDGFTVFFYDSIQQVKSTIRAEYGINYEKQKLIEARYNVEVENIAKGEKLDTEILFWDQKKEIIYSDRFITVTRGDEVITGDGLKSDQEFENIEIINPKGAINFVEDDL
jgi:LPS export ABC transporter protein LptC